MIWVELPVVGTIPPIMTLTQKTGGGSLPPSFEEVVNLHYEALYRFAVSLARNPAAAEDLTQQTFYTWARKGAQLRDGSKVKSWLFTTLHREFLRGQRRRTRFPETDIEDAEAELAAVTPAAVDRLDAQAMVDALQNLDDTFRAPLVLFYLEDESYLTIAEILDIPLGTVQSRIARGKKQLYRILSDRTTP